MSDFLVSSYLELALLEAVDAREQWLRGGDSMRCSVQAAWLMASSINIRRVFLSNSERPIGDLLISESQEKDQIKI